MSRSVKTNIQCSECGHTHLLNIWHSVNATVDPSLKDSLLKRELNMRRCHCGKEVEVAQDLLYHDMDAAFQVWLKYPDEDGTITLQGPALELASTVMPHYRLRIVNSRNQLIEKIRIFDDGLDDRIIEVIKFLLWGKIGGDMEPSEDRLFYAKFLKRRIRKSQLAFVLLDDDNNETMHGIDWKSVYLLTRERVLDLKAPLLRDEGIWRPVGQQYALKLGEALTRS